MLTSSKQLRDSHTLFNVRRQRKIRGWRCSPAPYAAGMRPALFGWISKAFVAVSPCDDKSPVESGADGKNRRR